MTRIFSRELSEGHLEVVRQLLRRRYGFWVKDEWLPQLREKLGHRMRLAGGLHFHDYWNRLQPAVGPQSELQELLEDLLNHESQFVRNPAHFAALEEDVLPGWKATLPGEPRRIASLGCSTGEEVYSLAIAVEKTLGEPAADGVQILGLDVSRRALEAARRAHYSEFRLREIEPAGRTRWFAPQGDGWQVEPRLQRRARFLQHNLMDPLPAGCLDVIVCCNVLIYFPGDVARDLLQRMHAALRPHGHLFLGHADSALDLPAQFRPITRPDTTYYLRLPARLDDAASRTLACISHEPASRQP